MAVGCSSWQVLTYKLEAVLSYGLDTAECWCIYRSLSVWWTVYRYMIYCAFPVFQRPSKVDCHVCHRWNAEGNVNDDKRNLDNVDATLAFHEESHYFCV